MPPRNARVRTLIYEGEAEDFDDYDVADWENADWAYFDGGDQSDEAVVLIPAGNYACGSTVPRSRNFRSCLRGGIGCHGPRQGAPQPSFPSP